MNKQVIKKFSYRSAGIVAALGLGVMLAPQKAQALFGIPEIVIDLVQELNSAKQVIQEIQMVENLKQQYDHLKTQAMQFKNIRPNWRILAGQIERNTTPNIYGETEDCSSPTSGTG